MHLLRQFDMTHRPAHYGHAAAPPTGTRVELARIDHPLAHDELVLVAHRVRGCWRYSFDAPDDWNLLPGRASSREALTFGELVELFEESTVNKGDRAHLLWALNSDVFQGDHDMSLAEQRLRLTRAADLPRPRSALYPDLAQWCADQQSDWIARYLILMAKARNGERLG